MGHENMERSYNFEISDKKEYIINNNEFRALNLQEITPRIYEIFEKIQEKKLEGVDEEDNFIIKDYISIVNNSSVDSVGTREFSFNIEIKGKLIELESEYKNALNEEIKKLNLEPDQLYAIYNWDHEFNMFDKKEEIINDETPFKSSYDGKLIINGEVNQ